MIIKERYTPQTVAVNSTVTIGGDSIGGFLCLTAGTVTLTSNTTGNVITALPVTAGVYVPMPFLLGVAGGTFTTAGGASGTLAL